jgi:hypothetical protein
MEGAREHRYVTTGMGSVIQRIAASQRIHARFIGVVYLLFFLTATLGALLTPGTAMGVPMVVAGLIWLAFLSPPLANYLLTPIQVIGFLAEAALMLWLLVIGVNVQRWKELAR